MAEGKMASAEEVFKQILLIDKNIPEIWTNLGIVLESLGRKEEAEESYNRSIILNPGLSGSYTNLASFLAQNKRHSEALEVYARALSIDPASASTYSNLGVLLACMEKEIEAEQAYRKALVLDPGFAKAYFNLSYLLLKQGRFEEGWRCLDFRYHPKCAFETNAHELPFPRWQGESLRDKSLLVLYEQGHGDEIQFCRYLPLVKAQGPRKITLICKPALKSLFSEIKEVDNVYAAKEFIPEEAFDYWVFPLSFPLNFNTSIDSIPSEIPYLKTPESYSRKWEKKIPAAGFRVALVWKGSLEFENDADRSLPHLSLLYPFWSVPGISFISLQKGQGEEDARQSLPDYPILHLGDQLENFSDTAAVIEQVDLVISVDTAVAHLAGALGKNCWILLPHYKTDWRWLKARSDSPWYPNVMRLYRQTSEGDWSNVISNIKVDLESEVSLRCSNC